MHSHRQWFSSMVCWLSDDFTNTSLKFNNKFAEHVTNNMWGMKTLVFEEDVLPDGTEVAFYAHGHVTLILK